MDQLTVKNIKLYGHCGISREERTAGALYEIDAEISWDARPASRDDDINSTVDYEALYLCIKKTFTGAAYKLIESAAENIARDILHQFGAVQQVCVTLRKRPPFDASLDYIEIKITRSR